MRDVRPPGHLLSHEQCVYRWLIMHFFASFWVYFSIIFIILPVTMTTIEEALSMTKIMLTKLCNKLSSITS
jgi:hypothetical protein